MDEKELARVMRELLARQLSQVDLTRIFKPFEAKLASTAGVLGLFLGKLTALLAPVSALTSVLSQTTSGLGLFLSAINILAATLAPILLPAFVVLGAAVLALSAMLWDRLKPALGDFYVLVIQSAIPAFRGLVDAVKGIGTAFDEAGEEIDLFVADLLTASANLMTIMGVDKVGGKSSEDLKALAKEFREDVAGRQLDRTGKGVEEVKKANDAETANNKARDAWLKEIENAKTKEEARRIQERGPRLPGGGGGAEGQFRRGLSDMIQQFKFEVGSRASFTGLSSAGREAQIAALGSPMEQRMRQITGDVIKALERIENAVKLNKPVPAVGL